MSKNIYARFVQFDRASVEKGYNKLHYSGILFDLYGTLVAPFRKREHMDVIGACAEYLGISYEECHHYWVETFPLRTGGKFASTGDNCDWIMRKTGRQATKNMLLNAEEIYEQFTIAGLKPTEATLDTLDRLTSYNLRMGLVSNCAPDVVHVWEKSDLARYFDFCAFSCQIGVTKPDPAIYQSALHALELQPNEALYIGDGSDEELSGAEQCSMQTVLLAADLSNTYDTQRNDVDRWQGVVIRSLSELHTIMCE